MSKPFYYIPVINRDVKNVIGYDSETQELYGIGWDDRSYMISSPDTDYTAWLSVSPDAFTEARNKPTYTTKDVVEWAPTASVTHNPWTGTIAASSVILKNQRLIMTANLYNTY